MQEQLSINDYYEDDKANPASIETALYRAHEQIPSSTFDAEVIIEFQNEPKSSGYRFRSLCDDDDDENENEDNNQRSIKGENQQSVIINLKNLKIEDTVNYMPLIEVELIAGSGDDTRIHPYLLKSWSKYKKKVILNNNSTAAATKQKQQHNPYKHYYCAHHYNPLTNEYEFILDALSIVSVPKYLIMEDLERYYYKLQQLWPQREFKHDAKFYSRSELNKFGNLKQARLKVQAVLFDKQAQTIVRYVSQCVKSRSINDISFELLQRSDKVEYYTQLRQNIRIIRASRLVGNVNGGEEVMLFAVINSAFNINAQELFIEFNQRENNQVTWSKRVEVKEIYNNSVIIFETPFFEKQQVDEKSTTTTAAKTSNDGNRVDKSKICEHPVKVFYRICMPNIKQYSAEWTFYYSKSKCTILDDLSESYVQKLNDFLSKKQESTTAESIDVTDDTPKKSIVTEAESSDSESEDGDGDEARPDDANMDTLKNLVEDRRKKMNMLVDRTCAALLEVAQSRSIHKLIKIQRYLLNVQNPDGNTPIHLAILNGHFDLVEVFVDIALSIPQYNIINVKNNLQLTPLLLAAHMEESAMCNFLLESTANLADADIYGQNCFHIAASKQNISLTKVLVNYVKANPEKAYLINLCNYEGDTPLHIACKKNSHSIVEEYLLSGLCRINEQNKRTGETPLHYTCSRNYLQLTKLLVKYLNDKTLDIDVQSFNGCTPLHMAIANRNYLLVRLLIKSNANLHIQSIEPVHGGYVLKTKNEEFFASFKQINVFKVTKPMLKYRGETDLKIISDKKELAVSSSADENSEKMAVEIQDVKSAEEMPVFKQFSLDTHCYDAFNYARGDKLMLKLLGTFRSDLYLPKEEINEIMDCELRKKIVQKMNLSYLKLKSTLETCQIDFINAIEQQMRSLNEDFKLKMRIVNNDNSVATMPIKRHTVDDVSFLIKYNSMETEEESDKAKKTRIINS